MNISAKKKPHQAALVESQVRRWRGFLEGKDPRQKQAMEKDGYLVGTGDASLWP